MKNTKPASPASRIVTVVIIVLIVVFAGLIVRSYMAKSRPASPVPAAGGQAAAGGAAGGGGQAARQGGSGGQAAGSSSGGQSGGSGGQAAGGGARNAAAVRVTEVVRGTIENSVVINGDVLPRTQVSIYPTVAGKLAEARFQVGDRVDRGTVVAMVDPSRPGEVYSHSPVVSTIGGTILQAPVNIGDTLSTQTAVYVVGDLSALMIETFVPERYSAAARRGLSAQVSLESLPGETFTAAVDEVSPVLDPASRTLRIRLRFGRDGRPDPRIKAGMFATVSLVTNTRRDVPVIPRASVINTYGSWIVFTVDKDNVARRRVVELGIENESFLEVLSGLELGEKLVSAGQNFLSDGDFVRIVD